MNIDPGQLPPLRPTASSTASNEPDRLASGALSPFTGLPYLSPAAPGSGAAASPSLAADSTSIDSQTRALMDGMQALGQRQTLGASAARLGALAAQVEDGSLSLDSDETALAMMRDEGL